MKKYLLALLVFFIVSQTPIFAANNTIVSSDSFASGSLAAGWAAALGNSECSITGSPHYAEPGSTTGSYGQIWTGATYPNDQISEVTVQTLTNEGGTTLTLFTRISGTGATPNGYEAVIGSGACTIYRLDAGTPTSLVTASVGTNPGDIWTFEAAGSVIILYHNGTLAKYAEEGTYQTGSPGFQLASSVAVTHAQVSAWRGYNLIQQDGVWQKQGLTIPAIASDFNTGLGVDSMSAVLHEGNAQILSGTVYKTWIEYGVSGSGNNIGYCESLDGITWTRYSGNPVIAPGVSPAIWKIGSTYYLYAQAQGGFTKFHCYTGTDGIHWTDQGSTGIGGGNGPGVWDTQVWTFQPVDVIGTIGSGGTAYALYYGDGTVAGATGLATSTDMIHWTAYSGNPVFSGYTQQAVVKIGSTYYAWAAQGNATGTVNPCEGFRVQSTDLINWTNFTHSIHRTQMFEGGSYVATNPQAYPNAMLQVGTQTYMYYVGTLFDDYNGPYQAALAIAPIPLSQLVTGGEDGTAQIATDNFTSGSGPLSANWTTPTGGHALQIAAGPVCEPGTASTFCGQYYSGATFTADQYSEATIATLGSGAYLLPAVRMQASGLNYYYGVIEGPTGGNYALNIQKVVAGSGTQIGSAIAQTINVGDTFRLEAKGSNPVVLSLFQNGYLVIQMQDFGNTYTTGNPGLVQYGGTVAASQISSWAGGNANIIPTYNPSAGSSGAAIGFGSASIGFPSGNIGTPASVIGF